MSIFGKINSSKKTFVKTKNNLKKCLKKSSLIILDATGTGVIDYCNTKDN